MFDHSYINENGQLVPVSQMSNADLDGCLADGVTLCGPEVSPAPAVLDRLRIEKMIRELGL